MKTFAQFNEEASRTLVDLEREYASSAQGRAASRQAEVEQAREEAKRREQSTDAFTQQKQRESSSTKKKLKSKAEQQRQEAEERKAERERKAQEQRQRNARLAANLKQASRTAGRLVKSGARKIGNLIGRS